MHESQAQSGPVGVENDTGGLSETVSVTTQTLPRGVTGLLSRLSRYYAETGLRDRAAMAIAIFSVVFQDYPSWGGVSSQAVYNQVLLNGVAAGIVLASLLSLSPRTSRLAIGLFIVIAAAIIFPNWRGLANHTYLALWTIPVAVLFREWWKSDLYAFYLRMTLGVVMIAAF